MKGKRLLFGRLQQGGMTVLRSFKVRVFHRHSCRCVRSSDFLSALASQVWWPDKIYIYIYFLGLLSNFYFMTLEIKYHGLLDDHPNVQLSGSFHSSISYRVPQAEVINDSHCPIFPIFMEILIPILNPFIPVDGLFSWLNQNYQVYLYLLIVK